MNIVRRGTLLLIHIALPAAAAGLDLDREIVLTAHAGAAREDAEIRRWQEAIGPAGGAAAFERLGWAYVAKARRTLDAGYLLLAEKSEAVARASFGAEPGLNFLRAHALHQLHRFHDAAAVARELVAGRSAPVDFALLSDVLVDQGKLAEAIDALQRFAELQPGAEALSRIAHVRWLRGDEAGALSAMEGALRAGSPREAEHQAWRRVRLSALKLQAGDFQEALALTDAPGCEPDYAPARLARGRALLALDRVEEATVALREAVRYCPQPEYRWWLAEALRARGDAAGAAEAETQLLERGAAEDPRTLALFLATTGREAARAVRLARAELAQRTDVFTHDTLAWALLAAGETTAADDAMRRALAEGTRDARLALHAGEIARAAGREEEAQRHFATARAGAGTLLPSERARLAGASSRLATVR